MNNVNTHDDSKVKKSTTIKILCPCPASDCRGFVFQDHKCALCSTVICKKCHVIIEDGSKHVCNPKDIASVECIKKECKACPGCNILCRKTEGCSQVWCMMCHKAWDWNTEKIAKGAIHATDYFIFLRRNGQVVPRAVGDGGCDDNYLDIGTCMSDLSNKFQVEFSKNTLDFIMRRWQLVQEYLPLLNRDLTPPNNLDIRLRYLSGEIDSIKWQQLLHMRDKEHTFKSEIHRMRCAYTVSIRDLIVQFAHSNTISEFTDIYNNINELHKLMQNEYYKMAVCLKSKKKSPFLKVGEM